MCRRSGQIITCRSSKLHHVSSAIRPSRSTITRARAYRAGVMRLLSRSCAAAVTSCACRMAPRICTSRSSLDSFDSNPSTTSTSKGSCAVRSRATSRSSAGFDGIACISVLSCYEVATTCISSSTITRCNANRATAARLPSRLNMFCATSRACRTAPRACVLRSDNGIVSSSFTIAPGSNRLCTIRARPMSSSSAAVAGWGNVIAKPSLMEGTSRPRYGCVL